MSLLKTVASIFSAHSAVKPHLTWSRWALPSLLQTFVLLAFVLVAFILVPWLASSYWLNAILIPFLVLSLAGLGLNLLTGYCGLLSLGAAAFMAVGAYATYNLLLRVPDLPLPLSLLLAGGISALFGVLVGLPSLKIKGFYLIVSTLAAQFFVVWLFTQYPWFSNNNTSGVLSAPPLQLFGYSLHSAQAHYLFSLSVVSLLTWLAYNLVHSHVGRYFRAIRDHELAALSLGVPVAQSKLWAFAISSFYLGIAGALWTFVYLGTIEADGLDLSRSFQILFIIIIGGLGSLAGSFYGAAFMVLLPILLSQLASLVFGQSIDQALLQNLQKIIFGSLIIFFLIREPEGLNKLIADGFGLLRRAR